MQKVNTLNQLLKLIKNFENSDAVPSEYYTLNVEVSTVLRGECIGSEYDYADIKIRKIGDSQIIVGRPVKIPPEVWEDKIIWYIASIAKDEDGESYQFKNVEEAMKVYGVEKVLTPDGMHEWIKGISKNAFSGIRYEKLHIPSHIQLMDDAFTDSCCSEQLTVTMEQLCKVIKSGLSVNPATCSVNVVKGNRKFNLPNKGTTEGEYKSVLCYDDKLTIERDKIIYNNKTVIEDFDWTKFYNSMDELVLNLVLTKYKVFINSDVTLGLYELMTKTEE